MMNPVKYCSYSFSDEKGNSRYYNAGINDFLIKPFRETDLFCKICNVLQIGDHHYEPARAEIVLKEELIQGPYDLAELKKITDGNVKLTRKMLTIFY
jgi:response regulator RpfG family c-di-GMP phosphodiesterase